jgi:hypothetical protein
MNIVMFFVLRHIGEEFKKASWKASRALDGSSAAEEEEANHYDELAIELLEASAKASRAAWFFV